MTDKVRHILFSAWLGFALAAIFFYPLAASLDSDPYYLQWQPAHSYEAMAALGLIGAVLAALFYVVLPRSGRGTTLALVGLALLPLLSLGAGVSRQLPIDDALRTWWENPAIRYGVPGGVALLLAGAFALAPWFVEQAVRKLLVILSPVSVVVVASLVNGATGPGAVIARESVPAAPAISCPSIVALLFDELSFAYLYDGTAIREEYPSLRAFSARSTNYLDVRAPGDETLISVPGYLAGRAFDNIRVEENRLEYELGAQRAVFNAQADDGLFALARRAGYATDISGYYFPYCEMLGSLAGRCRSFSFYNMSTVRPGFSPLHPIMTTLILWPRQFPLGLLKNRPFAALQRDTVAATAAVAARPLDPSRPEFRLVHFSVPHLPFVFGPDGYDPPLDPLRQRPDTYYADQVRYADRLLGEVLAKMEQDGSFDRSTVVVFSDHGFRSGGRETNSRHVPFLVKRPGQASREDVTEARAGEQLLMQVVQEGCPAR
jgi:hypothetical protein